MAVFIRICPAQTLLALLTLSSSPSLKSVFDVVPLWISLRAHHSSAQDHCPFMRVHIFRTFEIPRPCPCPHPHLIVLPCSLPPSLTRTRTRQPDFTLVLPSSSPTSRILVVADSLSPSPTRFRRC
ncbi:hypothetical protein C8Q78DRAFT_223206 [Trametes maxima]|nr:hypothetical protein C8Q78DRAFT_223206 [Trametes maxima]